jgi:cytidylate kinase
MGSLLVITGPPGAGKSTVAGVIGYSLDHSVIVRGDAFFGFLANGAIEPWLPESDDQNSTVTRAAAATAGRFATDGYATVYDGVVGPWFLSTFAAATGLAHLDYVMLLPPVEVCVQRVLTRLDHGFTDEGAARQMHRNFAASTIDERHVLRMVDVDVAAVAEQVRAACESGRLRYLIS